VKLVVGLGNPGPRYASTRHNAGVRVLEALARDLGIALEPSPFEDVVGALGRGTLDATPDAPAVAVALLAPHTFMNRSGRAVAAALARLPIGNPAGDLLVILDDVDLPFGRLRLRPAGSAGGHRGLADVLGHLGRRDVPRLRFGVGRPPEGRETVDYVLDPFSAQEERALPRLLERAAGAVRDALRQGVVRAMEHTNRAPEPPAEPPDG